MEPVLKVTGITKRFGENIANNNISFDLKKGEIHSLLGENGAGKSTLMNVIYGVYGADEGDIFLDGSRVDIHSPKQAISLGIGMVHQHFMLIPAFTVAENIVLGMTKDMHLDMKKVELQIQEAGKKYDLKIDPHALVADLSVGEQQRVEILKALFRGARILILDEPTAVLIPQEIDELFVTFEKLTKDGVSIIFISHKLNEVLRISDRVTILRNGCITGTINDMAECSPEKLASAMVGRDVILGVEKEAFTPGECVLDVKGMSIKPSHKAKKEVIKDFNLKIRAGEIVGLAGVDGNGQSEFVKGLTGLMKLSHGDITICGKNMTGKTPRAFIDAGVGHIPEDRHKQGLVLTMSVKENIFLDTIQKRPFTKHHILNAKEIGSYADKLSEFYDVRMVSKDMMVGALSGGNQQKVIVGRILEQNPKLLIAVHPTRGLDIGATEFVHKCLLKARKRGCAILLVSTELDEIMQLSDSIAVIYEGECMGVLDASTATKEGIGMLMAGMHADKQ